MLALKNCKNYLAHVYFVFFNNTMIVYHKTNRHKKLLLLFENQISIPDLLIWLKT